MLLTKFLNLFLLSLFLFQPELYSQESWEDRCFPSQTFKIERSEFLVLDSLVFNINESYIKDIGSIENISKLSECLKENPDLSIEVFVVMNINYDTISNHFLRIRSADVIRHLSYYNIDPSRIQVRDSLNEFVGENLTENLAKRKIIVSFKSNSEPYRIQKELMDLYENNRYNFADYFKKEAQLSQQNIMISFPPKELLDFKIEQLIDKYYAQYYSGQDLSSHYQVIPNFYMIEFGEFSKFTIEPEYIEDLDIKIGGFTDVISFPEEIFKINYKPKVYGDKVIYLNAEMEIAYQAFLGYEFKYDLDSMRNIPSNIKPVKETKKKLRKLKKLVNPRFEYLFLDQCNAYVFWDFNWEIRSPNTISSILINQETKQALIGFKNKTLELQYVIYELQGDHWQFKEIVDQAYDKKFSFWQKIVLWFLGLLILMKLIRKAF